MHTLYGEAPLPSAIRSSRVNNGNGLDMHILEAGFEPPGRPTLLHGSSRTGLQLAGAAAAAGYHAIAPDQLLFELFSSCPP